MKNKLSLLVVLISAILSTGAAEAGQKFAFAPVGNVTQNSATDNLLKKAAIEAAIVEGIRSVGYEVDTSLTNVPAISFDYFTLYLPDMNNMRILNGSVAWRELATIKGKQRIVAVCDRGFNTWRAGPSENNHVASLLESMRDVGVRFAQKCLKKE